MTLSLRNASFLMVVVLLGACSAPGPREPEWRGAARSALADYVQQRLEGHAGAARAYALALERMRDGGDLDGLHTVLLARCAMDVALLAMPDCGEFLQRAHPARAEALAYYDFLHGTLTLDRVAALPERYRAFAGAIMVSDGRSIAQPLAAIAEPVSRIVAAGVAVRAGRADDQVLMISASLARAQGWRTTHRAHEEARAAWLEGHGRSAEAAALRARLRALFDTTGVAH